MRANERGGKKSRMLHARSIDRSVGNPERPLRGPPIDRRQRRAASFIVHRGFFFDARFPILDDRKRRTPFSLCLLWYHHPKLIRRRRLHSTANCVVTRLGLRKCLFILSTKPIVRAVHACYVCDVLRRGRANRDGRMAYPNVTQSFIHSGL